MLIAATVSLLALLYVLLFMLLFYLLQAVVRYRAVRFRLSYVNNSRIDRRLAQCLSRFRPLYAHVLRLLEASQSAISFGLFTAAIIVLSLTGLTVGAWFFRSVKGTLLMMFMLGGLPYVWLRINLIGLRLKSRLEFLPAVEVFYQIYVATGASNVKTVLQMCLEQDRIAYPMKPVFEQLYRNFMTGRDVDESLRLFGLALGHIWADYFTGMLRVALLEGNDISGNLKDLIQDMRRARSADQAERNRLLEIRIANFTPILFLGLFIGINFKMNPVSAYLYYVLDPDGRNLILDALALIFASFLMGIYLSMKRM